MFLELVNARPAALVLHEESSLQTMHVSVPGSLSPILSPIMRPMKSQSQSICLESANREANGVQEPEPHPGECLHCRKQPSQTFSKLSAQTKSGLL